MITVGFSTRKIDENYITELRKSSGNKNIEVIAIENNGDYSLSEVYNKILDQAQHDIVVFCHDDLLFDTGGWGYKLISHFKKNPEQGIIGLAGTKYLSKTGRWWDVQQAMYGIVNHQKDGKKWESKYSKEIGSRLEETIIVDGLFFAVNKNNIKKRFDETVKGFHFYDLEFSFQNYLEKVPVGICTDIRVTHLSIGETNEQWEENRKMFESKYSENLPINLVDVSDKLKTFIFVHDQDIILELEKVEKYKNLSNYTYVFVGKKETNKIEHLTNVIISKNYEGNLEDYPKLTSFTGWYTLWKHKLIDTEFINMFEYDVNFVPELEVCLSKFINERQDMWGYIPVETRNYHFIQNNDWVGNLFEAIRKVYRVNLKPTIQKGIDDLNFNYWSSTSNTTFKTDVFNKYMQWMEPMIDLIKDDPYCGHAHERSMTFFSIMNKKKFLLTNGFLKHFQMDSHKTQGHHVDVESSMEKITNNTL